jgi:stress-induced morphogen
MSQTTTQSWEKLKTDDSRKVEETLRKVFPRTDAYRFNSASIRVRVVDDRFKGKSNEERDDMVEPLLEQLDPAIQADIMNLLTLAPDELNSFNRHSIRNLEFEDPSPSTL